ncbi:hypothetical protein QYM36_012673 [Artemia franciscana]|uniref:Uncharacterized protein n=1 Tax=Artemia franciscana TaxID=6661 RepID=A0AA88L3F1_ARTSF|nr:hypothetical protein QYM36_012673 [Artemia franciscana]
MKNCKVKCLLQEELNQLIPKPSSFQREKKRLPDSTNQLVMLATACFNEPQTEENILAQGWAMKMKKLRPDQKLFAEKIINDTLFEAGLCNLTRERAQFEVYQRRSPLSTSLTSPQSNYSRYNWQYHPYPPSNVLMTSPCRLADRPSTSASQPTQFENAENTVEFASKFSSMDQTSKDSESKPVNEVQNINVPASKEPYPIRQEIKVDSDTVNDEIQVEEKKVQLYEFQPFPAEELQGEVSPSRRAKPTNPKTLLLPKRKKRLPDSTNQLVMLATACFNEPQTEENILAQGWAMKMKKLRPDQKLFAEKIINDTLFEVGLCNLTRERAQFEVYQQRSPLSTSLTSPQSNYSRYNWQYHPYPPSNVLMTSPCRLADRPSTSASQPTQLKNAENTVEFASKLSSINRFPMKNCKVKCLLQEELNQLIPKPSSFQREKKHLPDSTNQLVMLATACFNEPQTEENILAQGWAMKMKKLRPDQKLFAEKIINDTLFEAGLCNLTRERAQFEVYQRRSPLSTSLTSPQSNYSPYNWQYHPYPPSNVLMTSPCRLADRPSTSASQPTQLENAENTVEFASKFSSMDQTSKDSESKPVNEVQNINVPASKEPYPIRQEIKVDSDTLTDEIQVEEKKVQLYDNRFPIKNCKVKCLLQEELNQLIPKPSSFQREKKRLPDSTNQLVMLATACFNEPQTQENILAQGWTMKMKKLRPDQKRNRFPMKNCKVKCLLQEELNQLIPKPSSFQREKKCLPDSTNQLVMLATACFNEPQTEDNILAQGWAMKMKKLRPDQKLFAEKIINDTLFEAGLCNLTRERAQFEVYQRRSPLSKSLTSPRSNYSRYNWQYHPYPPSNVLMTFPCRLAGRPSTSASQPTQLENTENTVEFASKFSSM